MPVLNDCMAVTSAIKTFDNLAAYIIFDANYGTETTMVNEDDKRVIKTSALTNHPIGEPKMKIFPIPLPHKITPMNFQYKENYLGNLLGHANLLLLYMESNLS